MIDPKNISAVVVTKGDRDLTPVLESLACFGEIIVRDNSKASKDLKVYGRYDAAFTDARNDRIYVQDDDALIDPLAMLPHYCEGRVLCNMTPQHNASPYYQWRIKLVGFGAIFHRKTIAVFDDYFEWRARVEGAYRNALEDPLFLIECDRVFTALNDCITCEVPVTHREFASDADRLWKQPDHRMRMMEVERRMKGMLNA